MENIIVKPILALRHSTIKKRTLSSKIIVAIIKLRTKSKYYHSELILDGKWISSDHPGGVMIRELKDLNNDDWDYVELPPRELTYEQHDDLWVYINTQDGKGYDYPAIMFNQLVKLGVNNINKWFCSEISSKIIQLIGYPEFMDITPADMDPGDLAVICNKM